MTIVKNQSEETDSFFRGEAPDLVHTHDVYKTFVEDSVLYAILRAAGKEVV